MRVESSETESDWGGDQRQDTRTNKTKTDKKGQTTSIYQKTEKSTKSLKQAHTLWTTNKANPNDSDLPDLMQDSGDSEHQKDGSRVPTQGNYNNNTQPNNNNNGGGAYVNHNFNQPTRVQSQVFISNSNTLQTGVFRQLIPYNGSSLSNAIPTANFVPDDDTSVHNLYFEGVTGRISAKIRCKSCAQIVQTNVVYEQPKEVSICCVALRFLSCFLCCYRSLLQQCKDAVHYCPSCGGILGVKNF